MCARAKALRSQHLQTPNHFRVVHEGGCDEATGDAPHNFLQNGKAITAGAGGVVSDMERPMLFPFWLPLSKSLNELLAISE